MHSRLMRRLAAHEALTDRIENAVVKSDGLADHQLPRAIQRLPDPLAARYLADTSMAGTILQDDQIAREVRRVRSTQVQQHAVLPGHRNDLHFRNNRRTRP